MRQRSSGRPVDASNQARGAALVAAGRGAPFPHEAKGARGRAPSQEENRRREGTSEKSSSTRRAVSVPPANIAGISSERGGRATVSPALGARARPRQNRRRN